jgi:DNA-directed RNA polymerase specialized sigma24 family protein
MSRAGLSSFRAATASRQHDLLRGPMATHAQDAHATTTRFQRIAAMHREEARRLERRVARQVRADPQTIEDACSFAWLQLLTHTSVHLEPPSQRVLGWLAMTATREAWRLEIRRVRDQLADDRAIDQNCRLYEPTAPGADELAEQRARLGLVAEIPERPRRFLMRQVLGYSYSEIAAHECVSLTTASKQIARARRSLHTVVARVAHDAL